MSVIDRDLGWKKIKEDLGNLNKSYTKVGLPEGGKVEPPIKIGSGGEPIIDMPEMVMVGAANEFGTKRIPERSYLRAATDEQREPINRLKEKVYEGILTTRYSVKEGLGLIGEFLTGKVRAKIVALKIPPNAPSTIRRKKSSNPLIDKGQLVQSIQHVEVLSK